MAVKTTNNKPLNPRGQDQSPLAFNRAKLYSGKALDFDGVNDVLTMPAALTSSLSTTTITHVVNFKTDFTTWSGARYEVFSYSERGVILSFNNGNIYVYYRHNASGWANFQIPVGDVKMQEWNHCVVVIDYDNTLGKAYINGQEVVSSTLSQTSLAYDSNALTIGAQSTYRWFDGQIAGFKIFNTALTAAQVSDLYNNPEKIVPTGVEDTALKLWLPMMEGAGTTAYDGSGNGNHGTISGATWTHGVGAPVAQTAVIDWNKGTNKVKYSEEFDDSTWQKTSAIVTADDTTAPDGSDTAEKIAFSVTGSAKVEQYVAGQNQSKTFTVSVWAKVASGTEEFLLKCTQANIADHFSDTLTVTTDWQRFTFTKTFSASSSVNTIVGVVNDTDAEARDIYFWGFQLEEASSVGPYVRTGATAQTSPVLLPQGLTTGRDITGVNLFENVRKQGALNLDGNSWAEVHDNASLDITPAMTMECWVDFSEIDSTAIRHFIVKPSGATWATPYARYALRASNASVQWWFESAGYLETYSVALTGWNHFAVTKDGTAEILYINGAQVDTATNNATITASAENLLLGQATTGTEPLDSPIAQPRIYNRALSAEEVERNYNAGKNIYK